MKLHSINQGTQKAIIEKQSQLVEINYANLHGHVMLIDSMTHYDNNGIDARTALKLLNDYLATTH